jgi:hypothetical protein
MFGFGAGALWGTPLTDYAGNAIANPTPILFATLQDVSMDISFDVKELHGENQFPVDVARGKGKIQCKAKVRRINGLLLNNLIFGQTMTSSIVSDVHDVIGAADPGDAVPDHPDRPVVRHLGARSRRPQRLGNPMVRVASAPATGQYSVAAGVYTLRRGRHGLIGSSSTSPTRRPARRRRPRRPERRDGRGAGFPLRPPQHARRRLPVGLAVQVRRDEADDSTKLDDFLIPEFDFSGFADSARQRAAVRRQRIMVDDQIEGRPFAVAPYKLGDLRRAAPFIDQMNETSNAKSDGATLSTLEGMMSCRSGRYLREIRRSASLDSIRR